MIVRLGRSDMIYGVEKIQSDGTALTLTFDDCSMVYVNHDNVSILACINGEEMADAVVEEMQQFIGRQMTAMDHVRRG